jgi:acyl-CoA thioesterase
MPYTSMASPEPFQNRGQPVASGPRLSSAPMYTAEMINSMGKAHGGITYSLADSAFGFAANSLGKYAVSIETSIYHIEALELGDYIVAESIIDVTRTKVGFHVVEVKRGEEIVALFKGVVYRTSKDW